MSVFSTVKRIYDANFFLLLLPSLNVARLSKLPDSVLRKAAEKSKEMEEKIKLRTLKQRAIRMTTLIKALTTDELNPESVIELAYNFLHAGGE